MNLKEIRERLAAIAKRSAELLAENRAGRWNDTLRQEWDALITETDTLEAKKAELEQFQTQSQRMEQLNREHNQPARGAAAGVVTPEMQQNARDGANGEERESRLALRQSVSERFISSEGWQEFRDAGYPKRQNSGSIEVGSFYHREEIGARDHFEGMSPEELFTLVSTGAFPSNPALIAPYRVPGIFVQDLPETNVRSVLLNLQTTSPVIQFFRQLVWSRAAAFVAEATATTGNSGLKPESGVTFEAASVTVETLASWMPVTNQTLEDEPQMRGIIEGLLVDDLRLAEDDALLNGSGVGANITGILNVSGIQVLDNTYFGATPVENAGNAWEDFDRITRARREIRITGRARASAVLFAPADLERLITITDTVGNYYSGNPFSDFALTRMRGLNVVETEALDEGQCLVLDGRKFAVFDRMQAAVTAGWIDQQFVRNMITLLAEERLALAPFRPAAAALVTLTSA
jgi:HK97 family phage major capsid protein